MQQWSGLRSYPLNPPVTTVYIPAESTALSITHVKTGSPAVVTSSRCIVSKKWLRVTMQNSGSWNRIQSLTLVNCLCMFDLIFFFFFTYADKVELSYWLFSDNGLYSQRDTFRAECFSVQLQTSVNHLAAPLELFSLEVFSHLNWLACCAVKITWEVFSPSENCFHTQENNCKSHHVCVYLSMSSKALFVISHRNHWRKRW